MAAQNLRRKDAILKERGGRGGGDADGGGGGRECSKSVEGGNRKGTDEGANVVRSPASAAASPGNVGNADPEARNANINCSHFCMRRIYHSTK